MPTPVFCCGGECGVISSVSAHWAPSVGTPTVETTIVRPPGLRSIRVTCSASTVRAAAPAATVTNACGRFYVYFVSLPLADCDIFSATGNARIRFKFSDSSLYCWDVTNLFGATGFVVTTGRWYLVDYRVVSASTFDAQVDGVALGQVATAAVNTGIQVQFGPTANATVDMCIDDLLISSATSDYPLGPGNIQGFVPNADGTHTAAAGAIVKGTTGTPVGANLGTDTWQWLNGRPILGGATDNTRLVNQQTNDTGYAEVAFEDWSLPGGGANGPRAVEVLIVRREAATTAGNSTFKLNDNGTENTILAFSGAGSTTDVYFTKQYATAPSTGVAWTLTLFNGVRFRFGYSSDANPDQYCRGVMIEAEFQPELGQALYARPDGLEGQQLFKQLLAT